MAFGLLLSILVLERLAEPVTAPQAAAAPTEAQESGFASAVERASPSVVNIFTTKIVRPRLDPIFDHPLVRRFFNRQGQPQRERMQRSLGSGVIMSKDGYVLTNNHVVKGADEILILLHDSRNALARVVGTDPATDLAVLEIDLDDLQPIPLGDPSTARVGDVVLAIGNPYGFGQTVTQGIISATGRHGLQLNDYENYIQTDAAINPGNSGGALVNADGLLLGINSALFSRSGGSLGIGLAIPADYAANVMDDLIVHGEVRRGWLGLEVQPTPTHITNPETNQPQPGLVIAGLYRGGPAEKGGLRPGDVILAISDVPVGRGRSPMYRIAMTEPGTMVKVQVFRDGSIEYLQIEVGQQPTIE